MDYELIAAYLAGECSETEKKAVENWRKAAVAHEQEFERYQVLWEASQTPNEDFEPDMQRAWQRINPEPLLIPAGNPPATQWVTRLRRIAAVLLAGLLLATGVYTWQLLRKPSLAWLENRTLPGEQKRTALADGSVVWLNGGSRLRYPEKFTGSRREVFLEGEAFFEVARDVQKPFLIHTHQSVTRVLGTSFSIRGYSEEEAVEVVVVTGKVAFSPEKTDQTVTLTPGEQGILQKKTNQLRELINRDPNLLAWKTKTLTFRNASLRQVLPVLENYFGVKIRAASPELLHCRFTGTFQQPTLEEIFNVFAIGREITHQKQDSYYLLSGKGCPE